MNDADLGYCIHAAGPNEPPLVFVHGGFLRSTAGPYEELLELLAQRYTVHALDLRGHGASAGALEGWSVEALADDIVAFARALALDRPVFVGHSLGAFIGVLAEIRHPGAFSALCLLAPGPANPTRDPVDALEFLIAHGHDRGMLRDAFHHMFVRPPEGTLELVLDAVALIDKSVYRTLREQNAKTSIDDRLNDVAAPVLLVCGQRDSVVPPERQHDMARKLPRCKEVVFATEGHMLPNESAGTVAAEIFAFLEPLARYRGVGDVLDRLVSSETLPGASILVFRNGKEEFFHATGMKDVETGSRLQRDTLFRLFSMTKPVVAAAVMILVDDGVLRLGDPVATYVPEFAELGVYLGENVPPAPARSITIEHLLTHTAGLSYWFQKTPVGALYAADPAIDHERWRFDPALGGLDGLARSMGRLPLEAQPGDRWHYSMSLEVAGIVIERATGESLDAFMKKRIFEPLAMKDTAFSVAPESADRLASLYGPKAGGGIERLESGDDSPLRKPVPGLAGGGGLVSTLDDYRRFAEMLRSGGELDGRRVLSEKSSRAMMNNQLRPDQLAELPGLAKWGLGGDGDGMGFGLGGLVVIDPPASGVPAFRGEYSWGGGSSTTFWIDPANRLTVVFMTQRFPPSAGMPRDQLHSAVYEALGLTGRSVVEKNE